MASLPLEVLYGIYLGVLIGIVPSLVAWVLGFAFKYITGVTIPGLGVVVLALAIAGANGGLLALIDPSITASENQIRLTVSLVVVLMLALYAHSAGDKMGASIPRKLSLRKLTERTLSTDVVELAGGRGQVRVSVAGEVGDLEGYPPLPADLRTSVREGTWTFPADIPLPELETRLADRLRTEFDLSDVSVRIDERARATVNAAPPIGSLSKRVPAGKRAVSVQGLVPTGAARGDHVVVATGEERFQGTVLGVGKGRPKAEPVEEKPEESTGSPAPTGGTRPDGGVVTPGTPTAEGGEGRLTVAVERAEANRLLAVDPDRLVVRSRGKRREFELVSLLRRAGQRFRRLTVRDGSPIDDTTIGDVGVRDSYGVTVIAVRHDGEWIMAPSGSQAITAGDDLFVVGARENLTAFQEAMA